MLLVIDNYDSFVFNLVHYVQELGADVKVVRNDAHSVADLLSWRPSAVLMSPGPGHPESAGVCLPMLQSAPDDLPILGVCLGHQAIGRAFGGQVVAAKEVRHGKTSPIVHEGVGLFSGLPSPFQATRYHSLAVAEAGLPDCLEITARTADGEIMGLSHARRPIFGVQFHPESIASEHGHAILGNFLRLASNALPRAA